MVDYGLLESPSYSLVGIQFTVFNFTTPIRLVTTQVIKYIIGGWKATCVGANSTNGTSMLKTDYKEGMTLKEAKSLAIKILAKTMDGTTLTAEKCKNQSDFSGVCSSISRQRQSALPPIHRCAG